MIRRHVADRFYLIAQNDHALLSGQVAAHYGNHRFTRPNPATETLRAASLHDCGWPLHDERPTLNNENFPLDVFETPLHLALQVWRASADQTAAQADYTQLLVSLHVLGLSAFAASHPHTPREVFELNQFQQREVERQEALRQRLSLRTDLPLHTGLAERNSDPAEQQLKRNHHILQFADRISLSLCCTQLVTPRIDNVVPRPGDRPTTLHLRRMTDQCLVVEPWPFDQPLLNLAVPYRSVPAQRFPSPQDFVAAYAQSPVQRLEFTLRPPT